MPNWKLSITNGLNAQFVQPDGSSRPGTDWVVQMTDGPKQERALVRTYSDRSSRNSVEQHAAAALSFASRALDDGWRPGDESDRLVVPDDFIASATPVSAHKPWWKFW